MSLSQSPIKGMGWVAKRVEDVTDLTRQDRRAAPAISFVFSGDGASVGTIPEVLDHLFVENLDHRSGLIASLLCSV
jgi:hypothetical protein